MQLTRFILSTLNIARDLGMTVETLLREARSEINPSLSLPELETELRDLTDRSWIAAFTPHLGAKRWRITMLGQSIAREQHLA